MEEVEPGRSSADSDDGNLLHDVAHEVVPEQVGVVQRDVELEQSNFKIKADLRSTHLTTRQIFEVNISQLA